MSALPDCPACGGVFGSQAPYPGCAAHTALKFNEIAVCNACGLGMALPRYTQAQLDAFYSGGAYWNDAVGRSRAQLMHERNQCRHRVHRVMKICAGRTQLKVLDIGAGHGWTAYWLQRDHANRVAAFHFIEPDDRCSGEILGRETVFPKARVTSIDAAESAYDIILLNHVLEHVSDPVECVTQVRRLLAPEGVAYFETPNSDQRFKADVFPHTWFFTKAALTHLARTTGVRELLIESFGRMPTRSGMDLLARIAFRLAAETGASDLSGAFDARIWRYEPAPDGIWLRWVIRRSD